MKTKFLIGALALPLFIASCNSDELDVIQNEKPLENAEIVGSKLIGQGMTISVSKYGEVKSRLNASGWETNDKVGLAWYNAQSKITDDQILPGDKAKPFAWFDEDGVTSTTHTLNPKVQTNNDIYGNHKFVRDESGNFVTEANVYEGFHFAYYPYVRTNKVGQMAVVANPTQTIEYSEDIYKNAFYISAQDMIREDDVTEDGTVEKKFDLKRLVNILNFKLQPSASWTSNELLNKLKVTSVTLTANQAVFTPSVKVLPGYLPSAVYTDGELDKNATVAKMGWSNLAKASKGAIKKDDAVKSIKTVVDLATATLDGVKSYRMFLFPTIAPATEIKGSNLSLVVEIEGGAKFNINYAKTSADNKAKFDIIAAMLNGEYKANNDTYTLQEVMDGTVKDVHNGPVSMTFELNESDFDASSAYNKISDREKWNAAVNLANALGQTKNITFTVTGDVEFGDVANDAVNLPTIPEGGSLTIKAEGAKSQIHFLGKVKWPAAVENITWTTASKILVGEGAALTVTPNGDLNAQVTIEEGGKVIVQNKANFNAASGSTLNNGRIEVVYGSHVKNIDAASTGDVAFVVKNTTKAYEINALKNSANASVTTLVVGKDINLNLNLSDVVNDPYGVTQSLDDLSSINVELTGGSITGDFAAFNQVKNLKVLSGTTNKITDVKPADIYVAKKAALEIATTEEQPLDIRTVNVEVEGTLNVNAETHFNNIINTGTINGNKTVHYVGTFNNANGTAKGVEPCDCPVPDSAEVAAVKDAWDNLKAASPVIAGYTQYSELIGAIATWTQADWDKSDEEAGAGVKFVRALSAWLDSVGYDPITMTAPCTVEKMQFQAFVNATGYSFGLN